MFPTLRNSAANFRGNSRTHTSALLLLLGVVLLSAALRALAAPKAPEPTMVQKAFQMAEHRTGFSYLAATVTLTTLNAVPDQPKVIIAQGVVRLEGDLLQGTLPMTFDAPAKAKPGKNELLFNVSRTNRIGLQWILEGKPLGYSPLQAFDGQTTADSLTAKVNWSGAERLVTVTIEQKKRISPGATRHPQTFPIKPKPTPKSKFPMQTVLIKIKPAPAPKAKGRKVKVTGRFVVTNSDDGVGGIWGSSDKEVELYGPISFGKQTAFNFHNVSARDNREFKSKAMDVVNVTYDDPERHFFPVTGNIWDHDKASASDTLWRASQKIDLLQILDSNREFLIKGDRNSESGDLYIRVIDLGEFYE